MPATPTRPFLRTVLALFAVAALLGACGGDDKKDDAKGDSSDGTTSTTSDGSLVDDPCGLLDRDDLSAVTGVEFDKGQPSENACTYTSSEGLAAIALNFTDLEGTPAAAALETAKGSCDEGTLIELEFSDADGGFGCTVAGVATVVATGEGIFAVLTGATLTDGVETDQILQDLATILEHAIAAS